MLKLRSMSALILAAMFCMAVASANAAPPVPEGAWLQLNFAKSAEDCRTLHKTWLAQHRDAATEGYGTGCFKNGKEPDQGGGQRRLAEYVFQIVSKRHELQQPAGATGTLTYRSLGPVQLASKESGTNPEAPGKGVVQYYEMLVLTKPTEGQDKEYNDWYDHRHVPEVIRNAGFISGQRFRLVDAAIDNAQKMPPYLVMFTLNSRDLRATEGEIGERIKDGRTYVSPAMSTSGGAGLFITPLE